MPSDHLSDLGVNLIGYIRAEMGLGTAARGVAHALEAAAIPFNILNFEQGNPSLHRDDSWKHREVRVSAYDFTLMVINPDNIVNAAAQVQKRFVKDRYTIGYWFWELPELPENWLARFPLVDEVWAASRFIQDAVSLKSPVPVFRVPLPIKLGAVDKFSRNDFSLPEGKFLFLSMGDVQSQLTRKNPLGVVRAFKKAFPRSSDAGLVLRINNLNTVHGDHEAIDQLREEIAGSNNIYILDAPMTRAEIDALLAVTDCFVSLHRSEGFGLGPAEAMSLGKPVILTKWSGNTDYMTSGNSVGIDYKLIPVGRQYGPYQPEQVWADPDLKQAAAWMKRLANEPELARKIGKLGQETIKTDFSPITVGKIIRKRLDYLRQRDRSPLQVFIPQQGKYRERSAHASKFRPRVWQCVKVILAQGLGDGSAPLRVDPGNNVGIVDLAAVSLRSSKTRKLVWRVKTRAELESLVVGGTAMQIAHPRLLRLANFGEDPQVLLPRLQGPQFEGSLELEAWIRLDDSPKFITEALADDVSLRLEAQKKHYEAAVEQLALQIAELRPLRELLAIAESDKARLGEQLRRLNQQRGQLLRARGTQAMAQSFLERDLARHRAEQSELRDALARAAEEVSALREQVKTMRNELEWTSDNMWKARVRRADATARLTKTQQQLQRIQTSFLYKVFKPLWRSKGGINSERPVSAKLALSIDSPVKWQDSSEKLLIKGWCFFLSGEEIAGVRAKVGGKGYLGTYGEDRPDVAGTIGHSLVARHSGFRIKCPVPIGRSKITLEAIVQGGDWQPFFEHEFLRDPEIGIVSPSPDLTVSEHSGVQAEKVLGPDTVLDTLRAAFAQHASTDPSGPPLFSVITATFNTKPNWLLAAAQGLLSQTLVDWEWCIVDDGSTDPETRRLLEGMSQVSRRVRVYLGESGGISSATNHALALASGAYVCFMDHDGFLAPDALSSVAEKLSEGFDAVYSDEDKYDGATGELVDPFYKPDWSPEYLRGVMYVGHLLTVRRDLARTTGFDPAFDGIQDFDFMLRLGETGARIGHIPKVLYHWLKTPGSVANQSDAKPDLDLLQKRAVDAHLARLGLPAETEIRGVHRLSIVPYQKRTAPRISIIIPTRDAPDLIGPCLDSLYERTSYSNYEVIVMDNGTTDHAALEVMRRHPVRRIDFPKHFNFSRVNNVGSEHAAGSYLVFLNNDTQIVTPDWLEHLLYYAEQSDVGAVGPLLAYPDGTVQHAGVALGMRGTADHIMRGFPLGADGYAGSLACAREVSAVTAACMMMSKDRFEQIGRFNEFFSTLYQDVDLCLRLRNLGLRIIYTPEAVIVHHESRSRKSYYDMVDRMFLLDQWESVIAGADPYYNRHLNLERGDYSLASRG